MYLTILFSLSLSLYWAADKDAQLTSDVTWMPEKSKAIAVSAYYGH